MTNNIAVLASTKGTDMQAIIDAIDSGELDAEIKVVISNKKNAYALKRARKHGIKAIYLNPRFKKKMDYDLEIAKIMEKNFGMSINWDYLISGAILIDVGKLLEYEITDGRLGTSRDGKLLRHPFSGVSLADRFGLPFDIQHIIAYHSKEGDLGKRTVESIIVHHADFVSFEPFQNAKRLEL